MTQTSVYRHTNVSQKLLQPVTNILNFFAQFMNLLLFTTVLNVYFTLQLHTRCHGEEAYLTTACSGQTPYPDSIPANCLSVNPICSRTEFKKLAYGSMRFSNTEPPSISVEKQITYLLSKGLQDVLISVILISERMYIQLLFPQQCLRGHSFYITLCSRYKSIDGIGLVSFNGNLKEDFHGKSKKDAASIRGVAEFGDPYRPTNIQPIQTIVNKHTSYVISSLIICQHRLVEKAGSQKLNEQESTRTSCVKVHKAIND